MGANFPGNLLREKKKGSGATGTVKTLRFDLTLLFPTCFRTHRCWLLPSRLLPLSSSSAPVPPTATWLCCAPPTGGRVLLLLFTTPTEKQKTRNHECERGCVHQFPLTFNRKNNLDRLDSIEGFWRTRQGGYKIIRRVPSALLHPPSLSHLSSSSSSGLLPDSRLSHPVYLQ